MKREAAGKEKKGKGDKLATEEVRKLRTRNRVTRNSRCLSP